MLPKFWQTRSKFNIDYFAVVHVIISMARLRALPTLATGDFTHVILRTRLPIFSLVYVEKDREGWERGYETSTNLEQERCPSGSFFFH